MKKNKNNIFCTANPSRMYDALWEIMSASDDLTRDVIFLPSRRAIRELEKYIAEKRGGGCYFAKTGRAGRGGRYRI
ncbi:MAG: hypothetical protein LBL75_00905 [Rickettsiales bacterium]|nr:hypothetical protein [Rickettsiales bacterium]